MPYDTPYHVEQEFRALGAVRCSVLILGYERDFYDHGEPRQHLSDDLVYFWDAQGREIGYWSSPCRTRLVFAPNHRRWGEEALARQSFRDLPVAAA